MKTRQSAAAALFAALVCAATVTLSQSDQSTEPSVPVGSLTAVPTLVQTGTHPTLNWSIDYPGTVVDVIDIEPPGRITPLQNLNMDVRVLGVAFQSGSTHIPIKAYRKLNGGGWSSFFYGYHSDVNPTEILHTTEVDQGQTIDFGSRYYHGGWGPFRATDQNTSYVTALVDGQSPPDYAPAYQQGDIVSFLAPYLDESGNIEIGPMDVIFLFENSSSSPGSPYFDMQDIGPAGDFPDGQFLLINQERPADVPALCSDSSNITMKTTAYTHLTILLPLVLGVTGSGLAGPETQKPKMRDAATDAELSRVLLGAQRADPMRKLKVVSPEADAEKAARKPKDLIGTSEVLCYRGSATLVPKRAVLHIPPRFADRVKIQAGAKIQTFAEFAKFNRSWIRTVEVSRGQANGTVLFDEKTLESIQKNPLVVVATFHGGPISVLPPKPEAKEAEESQPSTK